MSEYYERQHELREGLSDYNIYEIREWVMI